MGIATLVFIRAAYHRAGTLVAKNKKGLEGKYLVSVETNDKSGDARITISITLSAFTVSF
ncbi:MAG: hypothetical protein AAGI25_13615 [Bacteroidota bacterium]